MNIFEQYIQFYTMHQTCEPLGLNICRQFSKFRPETIYPFLEDSIKLFIQMTRDSKENLVRFRKLYNTFTKKNKINDLIYNNDLLRAISEDIKYHHTQVGKILNADIDLSKEMKYVGVSDDEISIKVKKMQSLVEKTIQMGKQGDQIPAEQNKKFKELVFEAREDPLHIERDVDQVMQDIKNRYESFRYIIGFYLAVFDTIDSKFKKNINKCYFNPKLSGFSNMYRYPDKYKYSKYNPRRELPCLRTYLRNPHNPYPNIEQIFNWVYHKQKVKMFRLTEAHNMRDVKQDRLDEKLYAIYTGKTFKYIHFEEIYTIQNDLSVLSQLINWNILMVGLKMNLRALHKAIFGVDVLKKEKKD
ncbi:hypothetical protein NEF87_002763 [Candidatus Lokiarchaeum ossiferum]|uniref:Uncharacterized protein n=1 Tax=Candidatus Lokiarchaeum ossiferum TaxID=2951803 RepID=A0ABY6HSJ2_9ARCH|nr:hypothetical protein NEF87_002763 [Candidatus Lokiarchaeum sp. B-35]